MKLSSFTALSALFALASLSLVQGTSIGLRAEKSHSKIYKPQQVDQEQKLLIIEGGRLFTVSGVKEKIIGAEALLVEIDRTKDAAYDTEEDKAVLRAAFNTLKTLIADLVNMKPSQAADKIVDMGNFDYRNLAHLLIYQEGYLAPEYIDFLVKAAGDLQNSGASHSFFYPLYDEIKKQLAVLKEADRVVSGDDAAPSLFTLILVNSFIVAVGALSVYVIVREWTRRRKNVDALGGYSGEKNFGKN